MKMSERCFRLSGTAWLLTIGLSLLAGFALWIAEWHLPLYAWRGLWLLGGGVGLVSMIVGGVCLIWDDDFNW
jgi:hypothetical protein